MNMLLPCTLYYDAGPGYLTRSIRTVCKYRKCSFLTGLITLLTDLLQANHQGQIGTSKTKSTGSPVSAPIVSFSEFFCFGLSKIFSVLTHREPVPGPRPDRFTLQIFLFRASQNFFPSSPGACSQASFAGP